jgi:hypothetical protein
MALTTIVFPDMTTCGPRCLPTASTGTFATSVGFEKVAPLSREAANQIDPPLLKTSAVISRVAANSGCLLGTEVCMGAKEWSIAAKKNRRMENLRN